MTKDKLEKEATEFEENYTVYEVAKRKDGSDYAKKVCKVTVKEAYLAGAEPREKQIDELEDKLANADYQLEGRDNEIRELKEQIEEMKCDVLTLIKDGMNNAIDQNIIERLAEKWEVKRK